MDSAVDESAAGQCFTKHRMFATTWATEAEGRLMLIANSRPNNPRFSRYCRNYGAEFREWCGDCGL